MSPESRQMRYLFAVVLALSLSSHVIAHNGRSAIAIPLENITIDGDLSDWPPDMRRYPILINETGLPPRNDDDFKATFRLGYNTEDNALYIAVEVRDESIFLDPGGAWNTRDGCEVYLDIDHHDDGLPLHFALYGADATGLSNFAQGVAVEFGSSPDRRWYEWRVPAGSRVLRPGLVVGFDVVVEDLDDDGTFAWIGWGRFPNKYVSSERVGDAILVDSSTETGRSIEWQTALEGIRRRHQPQRPGRMGYAFRSPDGHRRNRPPGRLRIGAACWHLQRHAGQQVAHYWMGHSKYPDACCHRVRRVESRHRSVAHRNGARPVP